MSGKGVVRSLKNFTKGFSDVQIKVREATSNDSWGPSGTLMNEIAQLTYNQHDFIEVMDMIDKRLNDKGKNWRHVFKALLLLDYCLHVGSENVVLYAKENVYVVKTLKEFQHIEENGKDVGANVRQKAKDIANLLQDDNRLREERRQRQQMRDRMAGVGDYMGEMTGNGNQQEAQTRDDDYELKKAMEESKRQAAEEERKRRLGEEADLVKALQLSEQEAKEKEQQANNNTTFDALFSTHDQQQQQQQPLQIAWTQDTTGMSNTNSNSQFFDNSMVNGVTYQPVNNPYLQQQQQQPSAFQQSQFQNPHVVGTPSPFGNIQQQQVQTTFNPPSPFGQSAFSDNPSPSQQQRFLAPFTTTPFQASMPTGSRNPFSQQSSQGSQVFTSFAQQQESAESQQSTNNNFSLGQNTTPLPSLFDAFKSTTEINNDINTTTNQHPFGISQPFMPSSPSTAGQSRPFTAKTTNDPRYDKLNSLLGARDDGIDTFGNTGSLRIPLGTGFANTIKPQENGEMAKAGNSTTTGFDVVRFRINTHDGYVLPIIEY
ncbi:hypothetical protein BC941DRAFT_425313 [Chlamydoabsidia padenii]|nr:hypothetical protein BC941DRAFT_425313 [Chlamydoabsidia padenii]